jgi:hypothetical protein
MDVTGDFNMAGRKLDRTKYFATSYGDTDHRYYQGGIYFNAQGDEVGVQTTPANSPAEAIERANPPARPNRPNPPAAPPAQANANEHSAAAAPAAAPTPEELREQFKPLNAAQVKKIYLAKGGNPAGAKGVGAVARMVDWLVAQPTA